MLKLFMHHFMKYFLFEQNSLSHLKIITTYASAAFLLPLGVYSIAESSAKGSKQRCINHCCSGRFNKTCDWHRNNPKFSDRYAWANSPDPDQTAPRGAAV